MQSRRINRLVRSLCLLAVVVLIITLVPRLSSVAAQGGVDAVDDSYTLFNTQPYSFGAPGLLGNDTGAEGVSVVGFDATTATAGAAVNVNPDGSWSIGSANGYLGSDSFTYTVADFAGEDTATVYLTYQAASVDAVDDNLTVCAQHRAFLSWTDNDTPSTATLTASEYSTTNSGLVRNINGNNWEFILPQLGPDAFSYTMTDGVSQDTATVYLDVIPNTFTTMNDTYTVTAGEILSGVNVLSNDSGTNLSVVSYVDPPEAYTVGDVFTINFATGDLYYAPSLSVSGTITSTYWAMDNDFGCVVEGVVTIQVNSSIPTPTNTPVPPTPTDTPTSTATATATATNTATNTPTATATSTSTATATPVPPTATPTSTATATATASPTATPTSTATATATATNTPVSVNRAPYIYAPSLSVVVLSRGGGLFISGAAQDPERDPITMTASVGQIRQFISQSWWPVGTTVWSWNYRVPIDTPTGTRITVTITATDARGASSSIQFELRVR